ncbi:MAG: putative metal-binding motif-containing protein, partial [Myxococcota bacterium]|nr:putative metal-binding motif-containing protein [Myxococcota bacterium]
EDDFDVDGDGFVPDEDVGLPTVYVDRSGALPGGDCDDTVDGAAVNPDAEEVWYDDIDNDCNDLTDDDDQDADGYLSDQYGGDDCDDTRPDVSPGAVEILSGPVDHDCDGDAETFRLDSIAEAASEFTSLAWSSPRDGVWSANSRAVFFSLASDRVDVTRPSATGGSTTVEYYDSAIAFSWDLTTLEAGPTAIPTPHPDGMSEPVMNGPLIDWQRNAGADPVFTLTDGHDFIATDDGLYGATGLMLPTGRALRMGGFNLVTKQRFGISYRLNPTSGSFSDFEDIALAAEADGTLHAVGCEAGSGWIQYMRAQPASLQTTDYDEVAAWEGLPVPSCDLHFYGTDGRLIGRTADGLQEWSFGVDAAPPVLTPEALLTGYTATDIEVPRDGADAWVVFADAASQGIVFIEPDGTESIHDVGSAPRSVGVQFDPAHSGVGDAEMFVTYVDGTGDPWLLIGDPASGFQQYALPVDFTANQTAAWADPTGSYVLVAVLGGNDVAFGIAQR